RARRARDRIGGNVVGVAIRHVGKPPARIYRDGEGSSPRGHISERAQLAAARIEGIDRDRVVGLVGQVDKAGHDRRRGRDWPSAASITTARQYETDQAQRRERKPTRE